LLSHGGFDREPPDCNRQDLEELHAQGLIRLRKEPRKIRNPGGAVRTYWEEWFFDVTDAGFEKVEREHRAAAEAERGPDEGASADFDWETEALPVLQAVYTASASAGADLGVSETTINEVLSRESNDTRTERVVLSF
jgi:hypothetical protein